MSKSSIVTWFAVLLWFTACSALVVWIGSANKSAFDPSSKLAIAIMDLSFERALIHAVESPFQKTNESINSGSKIGKIFHITQGDCFCEWLAKSHKNNLEQWSAENGFSSYNVDLKQRPDLAKFIPSTPAVLAIDDNGQLLYFGPYSRGSGCFSSSGKIDERLDEWKNSQKQYQGQSNIGRGSLGAMIDTDASGCYCQT